MADEILQASTGQVSLAPKLPRVKRNGTFATWEDIDAVIRPLLAAEGFRLSFPTDQRPEGLVMICRLSAAGIRKRPRSWGQVAMTPYLTLDILNTTDGKDNDGSSAGTLTDQEYRNVKAMIEDCGLAEERVKKLLEYAKAETIETISRTRYEDVMARLRTELRKKRGGAQ